MAKMKKTEKTKLLRIFLKLYPDPRSALNFKGTYQLVVSVILSAQCTDKKVNQVTPLLFKSYSSFRKLKTAKLNEVEKIIRPINYYKSKAKNLIGMARSVVDDFGNRLPRSREDLVLLSGVGRKTANVVLCEMDIIPTLPVDTHVFRVSRRLGLAAAKTPEKVEQELMAHFDSKDWRNLHHWMIFHGRQVCKAQRPLCSECEIAELCPSRLTEKGSG